MKVALFSRMPVDVDAPRGGVETVTLALTQALAQRGDVHLHVVTMERSRRRPEVSQRDGMTIHRLPGSRVPQLLDILAGPGKRRLKRYLCELRPDLVHFHETYGLTIGALPMPHVFTIHGFDHANIVTEGRRLIRLRSRLWRRVESWGLARQRHIISITPYVRHQVASLTGARVHDIDNPVAPACFQVERAEVPGRVFTAGWISHRKNTLGVVEACAALVRRGLELTLHIAGEEKDRLYAQQVREAIGRLGLDGRAVLLGRIGPERIRHELAQASVFVLPSRQENSPMAIAEAMAVGVPVVTANRCGMPYMVEEGRTGYLIDPEDVGAIADRVERLLRDAALRAGMREAARDAARKRFLPGSVAAKTVAVYRELLGLPAEAVEAACP